MDRCGLDTPKPQKKGGRCSRMSFLVCSCWRAPPGARPSRRLDNPKSIAASLPPCLCCGMGEGAESVVVAAVASFVILSPVYTHMGEASPQLATPVRVLELSKNTRGRWAGPTRVRPSPSLFATRDTKGAHRIATTTTTMTTDDPGRRAAWGVWAWAAGLEGVRMKQRSALELYSIVPRHRPPTSRGSALHFEAGPRPPRCRSSERPRGGAGPFV